MQTQRRPTTAASIPDFDPTLVDRFWSTSEALECRDQRIDPVLLERATVGIGKFMLG